MGSSSHFIILVLLILLQFLSPSLSLPLCTNSRAPFTPKEPPAFCSYNRTTCCNSQDDLSLKKQFEAMNVSDSACAVFVKSILCSRCDPFSAEIFRVDSVPRQVPILCNSTTSANSTQSSPSNFCSKVWNTCQNISISNSPFAAPLQGRAAIPVKSNSTKLTDLWQSQADFCNAFGGASDGTAVCFNGEPVALNNSGTPSPPAGMCLEKVGNGTYLNMVAHPDGSNRAFFSNQQGKIWLATIPEQGSGKTLELDEANPFLDLTDEVHFDTEFGMMGIAFHPKFTENGRFFASFNCDKAKWPGCAGICACNSDVNCDPSDLGTDNGAQPCQYHSVVAEFTVNGTASVPSLAKNANPTEVRRILTMGLPFTAHHGGQILFGPKDGYLYFMMGDGGGVGDPYNFSQNKKSLLGKIMRLDVDSMQSSRDTSQLNLWGNYSIPKDNPFAEDKDAQKEIWALGLRNPWRCSFDSARPPYFMCADVGQDRYEEVNAITKGGNYGWRVYEGNYTYTPPKSPGGNTSASSITHIFPVMGYNHNEINQNEGSASITGGYFYRATADPCMYGRYLYADLYGNGFWAGAESPENSGNFTTSRLSFGCAPDSPLNCTSIPGGSRPSFRIVFSFGEDNNKDIYVLADNGVYRIVPPSRCKYTCATENVSSSASPAPASTPSSGTSQLTSSYQNLLFLLSSLWMFLVNFV